MSKLKKAVKIIERLRGERNLLKQQLDDVCADRAFLKKRCDGYEESCLIKDREIAQLHAKLDQISLARTEPCETCISLRKHIDLMLDRSDQTKEEIQLLQDQSEKTNVEIQLLHDQIALMQIRLEMAHKELDQRAAPTQMLQEKTSSMFGSDDDDDDDDDTEPSRAILAYKPTQTDRQETRESEDFNFFDDPVKPIATPATAAAIVAATTAIAAAAAAAAAPTVVATRKIYVGLGGENPI